MNHAFNFLTNITNGVNQMITNKIAQLVAIVALIAFSSSANALLLLSGDGNITSTIGGSNDNDVFFSNVLQGGSTVTIHQTDLGLNFAGNLNNFYNGLTGVSSSIIASGNTITSGQLSGSDLFVSILPEDNYTAGEISAMSSFLSGGGSIFFMGENGGFDPYNSRINDALLGLGSSMSIMLNSTFDTGFRLATGSQIAVDALTTGVNSFSYAAPNEVMVDGGTALLFGTQNQPFISYESTTVPEPSILALLSIGLFGFSFIRRKI